MLERSAQSIEISYNMRDFDYDLPQELIAQTPIEPRDSSRLLVLNRATGGIEHRHFRDIGDYLRPGDLLIANQSRVIPARLLGKRVETGGAVEVLLLAERRDLGPDHWETLVRPGRRLREGSQVVFGDESNEAVLHAEIMQRTDAGGRIVRFWVDDTISVGAQFIASSSLPSLSPSAPPMSPVRQVIDALGEMPLPPYIHEPLKDPERYQTVYGRIAGSAAASTAGLHFTTSLLDELQAQGVKVGFVTLHVGLDTFRPVEEEDYREHKIHSEEIDLDEATAQLIRETRAAGGRIVVAGTTPMRVLESVATFYDGDIRPFSGATRLYITPGYRFKVVDALITNFHLPRSTLLLLVSAFAGKALIEKAYQEAIRERYRFFSFGDATLIL